MRNGKFTAWLAGAALVATMSGCLEGATQSYNQLPETYSSPMSQTQTSVSTDLLNADGVDALKFPLGTNIASLHANPLDLSAIYKTRIEVSTESELAAAMLVPDTDQGHLIVLMNSIIVDHDITLWGDADITSVNGSINLRFSPNVKIVVQPSQKAPTELNRLRLCTSVIWRMMSRSSSLRIDASIDGSPVIENHAFFHLIVAYPQSEDTTFVVDSAADANLLALVGEGTNVVHFSVLPLRTWVARAAYNSANYTSSDTTPYGERVLVIGNPSQQTSYSLDDSNCQNLKAGVMYPYEAFENIRAKCSNAHWDQLATTFATCGGAQ